MLNLIKIKNIIFQEEFIFEVGGFYAYEYDIFIEFLNKGYKIFYIDNIYIMKRIISFLLSKRKGVYSLFFNNHYYKIFMIEQKNRIGIIKFEEYLLYDFINKCGTREKLLCSFDLDRNSKEYITKQILFQIRKNIF